MAEDRSGYGGARPKTTPPPGFKKPKSHYKETDEFLERRKSYRYEEKVDSFRFGSRWAMNYSKASNDKKYRSYDSLKNVSREDTFSKKQKKQDTENEPSTRNFRGNIKDRKEIKNSSSNLTDDLNRKNQHLRSSEPRYKPRTTIETLKYLDVQDGDSIVRFLIEKKHILTEWLLEGQNRPDVLPLILSVLSKAFSCNYLSHKTADLIHLTIEADLLNTIALHIVDLQSHGDFEKSENNGLSANIKDILNIVLEMTSRNPSSIKRCSRIHLTLGLLVENIQKASGFKDETIMQLFGDFSERINRSSSTKTDRDFIGIETPPDDFRNIDIFPGVRDVHNRIEPFMRKNKTKGGYIDLDHYLDVQFRLLREDFIGPLRDGINEYIRSSKQDGRPNIRNHDLRIYPNVRIISPVCLAEGLCFKIQLSFESYQRVDWRNSKRLIFGSLLCLTKDDFETFIIATVAGRELEDLATGNIDINFENSNFPINARELFSSRFTMAETTAFFESYRHVLSGLQKFKQGDLPFERYLLKCETNVKPPAYLTKDTTFDFEPLINDKHQLDSENNSSLKVSSIYTKSLREKTVTSRKPVQLLNSKSWPSHKQLHLDESQFNAVKSAITKEFALIQGPPGTGKTYIGLKIAKLLLHNTTKVVPDPKKSKPMLIVCFTNHALDQFLEGISTFYKGNILRVGGQSKSLMLKEFSLQKAKSKASLPKERRDVRERMNEVAQSINKINTKIDCYRTFLLSMDFLGPFVLKKIFQTMQEKCSRLNKTAQKKRIVVQRWLNIGQVLNRFGKNRNELDRISKQDDDEIQDIITQSNGRKIYDDAAIDFDKERLKQRERVMKELRETVVAFYFQDEVPPHWMKDNDWKKQQSRSIRDNQIIQKFICYQDIMSDEEEDRVEDPWKLSLDDRWRLYRLWVRRACQKEYERIAELENTYKELTLRYKESQMEEDSTVMKRANVIGMTTTCAARYLALLQDIRPNIVIVEEAAEVLEAHIVTTLSKGCQHLILIGDHKQLRPSPSVHALATKFNMNVSLFERMIMNGVAYDTLELQHRMRPEISVLISGIYSNLRDHESVKAYDNIRGVSKNVFLINHTNFEDRIVEGTSHSNKFEAEYIVALCRYLLKQGYQESQITVLTTYTCQMFLLRRLMPREEFGGVKVTVVDNYQGEENDIILLSLVRSNAEGIVGFLKTENRICVALSRAKKGFYMVGNFTLLALKSELWKGIVDEMTLTGQIGDGLSLYCQNHPETEPLVARDSKDFAKAPEGGCGNFCEARLDCGHCCRMFCHPTDKDHKQYKCTERCTKSCEMNHPCKKRCHEECGKCPVIVEKKLTRCQHVARMPCGKSEYEYYCEEECNHILSCGHTCQNPCGSSHSAYCKIEVEKYFLCGHTGIVPCGSQHSAKCKKERKVTLKCGHTTKVPCEISPERAVCRKQCRTTLDCGHPCSGTCNTCFNGRFHQRCRKSCKRTLICGHECLSNCSLCLPCTRKCENKCVHSRCTKLCGEPCMPCMEKCAWQCPHKKCTKPCSAPCNRGPCNRWCRKKLPCRHFCIGLCGEPCPKLCRICNKDEVTTIFFGDEDHPKARFISLQDCGHIIESRALDKYMYMTNEVRNGDTIVQLKGCPICKTPIRKSYRYGQLINKVLADIEQVKHAIIGDKDKCEEFKNKVKEMSGRASRFDLLREGSRLTLSSTSPLHSRNMFSGLENVKIISEHHVVAFENQCILLEKFSKTFNDMEQRSRHTRSTFPRRLADKEINPFEKFKLEIEFPYRVENDKLVFAEMKKRLSETFTILSEQEIFEIKNEITRCNLMGKIKRYGEIILNSNVEIAQPDIALLQSISRMKVVSGHESEVDEACKRLDKLTNGMNITEAEKQMILKTVGLSKGHWFKCPNGHVYAIGECGGANQEGLCPECKAKIGGKQHQLAEGNTVATEMDGAKYGAYSEEANRLAEFLMELDEN